MKQNCRTLLELKKMEKKITLVIGASKNPTRYSNIAIHRLVAYHQQVVAIGLRKTEIAGVTISTGTPLFKNIHTVTLYLNPQRQEAYYDYIISLQPKRVIFNPGTENPFFYDLLTKSDITFEIACTLVLLGTNQY